jgi:hypothetical protein
VPNCAASNEQQLVLWGCLHMLRETMEPVCMNHICNFDMNQTGYFEMNRTSHFEMDRYVNDRLILSIEMNGTCHFDLIGTCCCGYQGEHAVPVTQITDETHYSSDTKY